MNAINREAWLSNVAEAMRPLFEKQGATIPANVRVSCSFPSKSATSAKRRRIGECWSSTSSDDGTFEIMVSPTLSDPLAVTATLAHELVHATAGLKCGHKGLFRKIALGIGLEGKMTATVPGEAFKRAIEPIIEAAGPYPHAELKASSAGKMQGARLIKVACPDCGYIARVTRKWLDEAGAPVCPTHGEPMEEEVKP